MVNVMRALVASIRILGVVLLTSNCAIAAQQDVVGGIWAAGGQRLVTSLASPSRTIQSPDGTRSIRLTDDGLVLTANSRTALLPEIEAASASLIEVLWGPHSDAFVVNASDGGLVGTWDTYYYA